MIKQIANYRTDAITYAKEDSGCKYASDILGCPSECLRCPLPNCIYEPGGSRYYAVQLRNEDIQKLWREGHSEEELAFKFGISLFSVQRIVVPCKQRANEQRNQRIIQMWKDGESESKLSLTFRLNRKTIHKILGDYCKE